MANGRVSLAIVAPPRFAWMREWDCTECEHESLRHPVFVTSGDGPRAVGTSCAARLLGRPARTVTRQRDLALAEARRQAENDAERAAKYRQALAEWREHGTATVGASLTVPQGPGVLFDALRSNHARWEPTLLPPAAFASFLEGWLADHPTV